MKKFTSMRKKVFLYITAIILVLIIRYIFSSVIFASAPREIAMYLLLVVVSSIWLKREYLIIVSVIGALCLDYFFTAPLYTLDFKYIYTYVCILFVGLIINTLSSYSRQQTIDARESEAKTSLLYHLSKDLAAADSIEDVTISIRTHIGQIFDCQVAVFLPIGNKIKPESFYGDFSISEQEKDLVVSIFENKVSRITHPTEFGTEYLALKTSQGIWGVIGVKFDNKKALDNKEINLLNALASQAAVALQRSRQAESTRQLGLIRERDKLQVILLNSISHDFRTPLVSIKGVLSSLLDNTVTLNSEMQRELLVAAYEDVNHLNHLVGNLLDMTRIEAGVLKVDLKSCELRDVIGASLQFLKAKLKKRNVVISIPSDLPEVSIDFVLMMRVFINLLDNAIKYSSLQMAINISAIVNGNEVQIDIKDNGAGIPEADLTHVFDKFYRTSHLPQDTGIGLGLSICKGIVEVHGGRIFAKNNVERGATFTVVLPLGRK